MARVVLVAEHGSTIEVRAPIDPGAQRSFVIESVIADLGIRGLPSSCSVVGFGESETKPIGYMEPVPKHDSNKSSYYMPHHAVFRQGNPDKIRVVFNASQRASSGQSLNDFLLPGAKLQLDITVVIMHHDDIDWQRIVWRLDRSQPIQDYRATTVTYGTALAPYLALRVLQQLAHDEGGAYPEAAIILRHQMYVDDAFGGADDVGSALRCRDQLITVLKSAGMLLSKWAANDAALLGGLDSLADSEIAFKVEESVSALGLLWQPRDDVFGFRIEWASAGSELTKRGILSDISRLFDPMGWLAPVLITAKIVLQDVWLSGVDWDDRVPGELCKKWSGFRSLLGDLTKIKIQRWIGGAETDGWTLHGFADASKRAYAAAIYAVLPGCSSTLLIAKTKIAPVKVQSLPRLELCGAHLLARLIGGTLARLRRPPDEIHLWTDSRVVLDWLASHPSRWQTFVANRVSEIVSSLPQAQWHHVRSAQNPADCATRGVTPAQLSTHDLWWRGPAWLVLSSSEWPMLDVGDRAESLLVEQREAEVAVLPRSSPLARLTPFVCHQGLIRVGGRLQESSLSFQEKHPVILPGRSLLVRRLIEEVHALTLHGGTQLMLSHIGRSLWIIQGRRVVSGVFHRCVRCLRFSQQRTQQQMAPLPAIRLEPQRPFASAGVDYAGPVPVLFSRGRGAKATKGYIAIFVCLVTRAVHIEIVSDLSTGAFLAAYSRFVARRGCCSVIYSDNATNFRGAAVELNRMFSVSSKFIGEVASHLALKGTSWKFIPPRAPHFGGLWEAAVRSFKFHLRRAMGSATLTFEELSTLAARIEACLNSRPLCTLSGDALDHLALTPGHFLVGSALLSYPEPYDESHCSTSLNHRWKQIVNIRNSFWSRWRKEVLNQLQQRNKWLKQAPNIEQGDVVLVKDELAPPAQWPLARVLQVHPGKDGLVRVVTLKTSKSVFLRPVVKLIRLPTESQAEECLSKIKSGQEK
ncbi:uncharacterized protein LOC111643287 [Copidosoma floridanum]|uniref:uncharacterized protein LOC111643287 n=1 Tax=Copidosoma floridanum TaxID=29053 RepID=UPI000C6F9211|nr:uncharacterized protein LOC111643287 [Copidosoma floridanum]